MNLNFVGVSGYGWSGSSAVVDLLKEFEGYGELDCEFRLIKDPYGLLDLESSLVDIWSPGLSDASIKDFLWFCESLNRKKTKFGKWGNNYSERLGIPFLEVCHEYINELTEFKYEGHWFYFDMKLSHAELLYQKVLSRFGVSFNQDMFLSRPSKEQFVLATRKFLQKTFKEFASKNHLSTIVLDQGVPATFPACERAMNYLGDQSKLIIVDRDPRDIFVDLIRCNAPIGRELKKGNAVEKFIAHYKALRIHSERFIQANPNRVLKLMFEDLVINYEESVLKLERYLEGNHVNKFKHFEPDRSLKNIGIWKSYPRQEEINKIFDLLGREL